MSNSELLAYMLTLQSLFAGVLLIAVRFMIDSRLKSLPMIDKRVTAIESEMQDLHRDMPRSFVPREDYIRNLAVMDAKLDRLWEQLMIITHNRSVVDALKTGRNHE